MRGRRRKKMIEKGEANLKERKEMKVTEKPLIVLKISINKCSFF